MPETFDPVTLSNDTGVKLNAAYFNRLETNLETIDDRAAALERGILAPITLTASGGAITPDAAVGALFRHTATANVILNEPLNGANGQFVTIEVTASGSARTLSFAGGEIPAVEIPANETWVSTLICDLGAGVWRLQEGGSGSGGTPGVATLTETTGVEVAGRVLRLGATDYVVSIPTGGPDSAFFVADKANDANDASLLLRSAGVQKAEIGLPGDNDLHLKTVTGAESSPTYTDALICKNATGLVFIPQGLGVGAVPAEKLHVVAASPTTRLLVKVENTATTGGAGRSTGVALTSGGGGWYLVTDVGINGGDNLGIMSDTAGYPPPVMVTPTAVGIGTDAPGAKLDVNGALTIRGDNGLSPMRIRGRKTTTGAPTTGTWAAGDAVMDANGQWYLCSTAGTPGTWKSSPVVITQAAYDALGTKDPNTIYLVVP